MTGRLDWDLARERLAAARLALDEHRSPSRGAGAARGAGARARRCRRSTRTPARGSRDFVRFTLCGERFAVAAEHVIEALPLGEPTPVPGTPAFLLGVLNHRGRVLPVLDLRRQLVPEGNAGAELTETIAVSIDGTTFGIAAEAVEETARERVEALDRALVTVLDLEALAADPRLRIDDE